MARSTDIVSEARGGRYGSEGRKGILVQCDTGGEEVDDNYGGVGMSGGLSATTGVLEGAVAQ